MKETEAQHTATPASMSEASLAMVQYPNLLVTCLGTFANMVLYSKSAQQVRLTAPTITYDP